jgi:hypothetical protein
VRSKTSLLLLCCLTLAASGCAVHVPGGCDAQDPPAPVSGCMVPVGGWGDVTPQSEEGVELQITGTVIATGTGEPAEQCMEVGGPIGWPPDRDVGVALSSSALVWLELEDATGDRYVVAITGGDSTPAFEMGEPLAIDYSFAQGDFGPDVGSLELRDEVGGLRGWVAEAGGLNDLRLPDELEAVTEAAPICYDQTEGCGDWSRYDLDVVLDGATNPLPYGATLEVGDLALLHGGHDQQTGAGEGCPDWFVAHTALGLFPIGG